jgi:hypothetical protein
VGGMTQRASDGFPSVVEAKTVARAALELEPRVGVRVLRGVRWLESRQVRRSLGTRVEQALRSSSSAAGDVLDVPPTSISHSCLRTVESQSFPQALVSGDWDRSRESVTDSDLFFAMKSVLEQKACAWTDTPWYKRMRASLEAGQTAWGCRSDADLQRRVDDLERRYIMGLRGESVAQVLSTECDPHCAASGEVGVAVGRDGELLLCEGAHLLCLALLLGVTRMRVRVRERHPEWAAFRGELLAYAESRGGLYQPALHHDLATIPSTHRCEDRWQLISSRLSRRGGTALDVGANLGFFDNRLEDLGYRCTALESDATAAHFMKGIRDANGHRFAIVADSLPARGVARRRHFDVVLALSIFHHFLKTRSEYYLLERFLADLDCDEMFFEPHMTGEAQMAGAHVHLTSEAFARFVAERTRLTVVDEMSQTDDHRTIYHLRKPI